MPRVLNYDDWLVHGRAPMYRRLYPVTFTYVVVTFAVSGLWKLHLTHDVVVHCCAYENREIFSLGAVRMFGGAFLITSWWEVVAGMALIALVLPRLEERIGSPLTGLCAIAGHLAVTMIVGGIIHIRRDHTLLNTLDTGSSVVLVVSVTLLAWIVSAKRLAVLVIGAVTFDVARNHDLASAEHVVAVVIGTIMAVLVTIGARRR